MIKIFPVIKILLFIVVLIVFTSCSEDKNEVAFYSFEGKYISADKSYDSVLISNRDIRQSWETFIISKENNNKYSIKTLSNIYVAVDYNKNNTLYANSEKLTTFCLFDIKFDDKYNNLLIRASNGNFVSIEKDKVLRANSSEEPIIRTVFVEKLNTNILNSYFNNNQLFALFVAFVLIIFSLYFFQFRNKLNYSIFLLLLGGIALRYFAIILDPYLNLWDERIHALVAKNMIENPFKPILFTNPVLDYDYKAWCINHIWLHKQPLFLWQMALSLKIFGVNEIALRVPALIMSSILILVIFRLALLISNKKTAYYAALLYTCSNYTLEFVSGRGTTDHNDLTFAFYVSLSIWAFVEFYFSEKKKWIVLIGLFSGLAILNKWLTGLLVYSAWGIMIISNKNYRFNLKKYAEIAVSLLITVIVFLPWQIYIFKNYPLESKFEYEYNTKHFFEVVEGHSGDFMYHFNQTIEIYGVHFIVIVFSVFLLNKLIKTRDLKIALNTLIIVIYVFFTLAATKMFSFTYAISILIFIALASLIYWFTELLRFNKRILKRQIYTKFFHFIILLAVSYYFLNLEEIQRKHTNYKRQGFDYKTRIYTHMPIYKKLQKLIPDNDYVIFNVPHFENISLMFYSDFVAYDFPLSYQNYLILKSKNVKIAVFDDGNLPEFIKNDKELFIIK